MEGGAGRPTISYAAALVAAVEGGTPWDWRKSGCRRREQDNGKR